MSATEGRISTIRGHVAFDKGSRAVDDLVGALLEAADLDPVALSMLLHKLHMQAPFIKAIREGRVSQERGMIGAPLAAGDPDSPTVDREGIHGWAKMGVGDEGAMLHVSPDGIHSWVQDTLTQESVLQEAQRLVHGDRGENYGHPFDDFGRTAGMVSALLKHKLREPLTQEEVAMVMICVKLSREANRPKRDNVVDVAGYAETLQMVKDERERRGK